MAPGVLCERVLGRHICAVAWTSGVEGVKGVIFNPIRMPICCNVAVRGPDASGRMGCNTGYKCR